GALEPDLPERVRQRSVLQRFEGGAIHLKSPEHARGCRAICEIIRPSLAKPLIWVKHIPGGQDVVYCAGSNTAGSSILG
ncbi:hypothetical protein, partial [Bradyrhizobium elkanii]|uniref:hypothetical protein n=1 Tax=Bradyrhizobium elkanii TaxID=29448 RepID=UPI001AEC406B